MPFYTTPAEEMNFFHAISIYAQCSYNEWYAQIPNIIFKWKFVHFAIKRVLPRKFNSKQRAINWDEKKNHLVALIEWYNEHLHPLPSRNYSAGHDSLTLVMWHYNAYILITMIAIVILFFFYHYYFLSSSLPTSI